MVLNSPRDSRSPLLTLPRTPAPRDSRSLGLKLPGTHAPWDSRSPGLTLPGTSHAEMSSIPQDFKEFLGATSLILCLLTFALVKRSPDAAIIAEAECATQQSHTFE